MTDAAVAEALEETLKHQEAKASDKSASSKKKASDKLVLVVIDEARNLVDNTTSGLDHFHLLLRALVSVNNSIGKEGEVFGVLVDTNPRITTPDPLPSPHKVGPSYRGSYFSRNLPSFRPLC
ncbi:hypothetical protein V7S43_015188 [Phytophthora oleae]|uniref:ATPase AAA-type core domain-containing protein n=1 Tax=Phytophthora oleae TaxID=2107226 RepID=A0ABD3F026_9STRA